MRKLISKYSACSCVFIGALCISWVAADVDALF